MSVYLIYSKIYENVKHIEKAYKLLKGNDKND